MYSLLAPRTPFDYPSPLYAFLTSPVHFIARNIYHILIYFKPYPVPQTPTIRVVCISDTHTLTRHVPEGDLLIHAGDLTNAGNLKELQAQLDWLKTLPHPHKVVLAGNHDSFLDPRSRKTLRDDEKQGSLNWSGLRYLQHSTTTVRFPSKGNRSLTLYGAPQIPACGGPEFAFQYARGQDAWTNTVPSEIDILVSHCPPKWHLDLPIAHGCEWLLGENWRIKPKLHVFGHIHANHGTEIVSWDGCQAAYERIRSRKDGFIKGFLSLRNWIDFSLLCGHGVAGMIWRILWGGESERGILVNAALMHPITGALDHEPEVVFL